MNSEVPAGNGTIWLDNMECTGNERRLAYCSRNKWGVNDCSHSEDVGIECIHSTDGKHWYWHII